MDLSVQRVKVSFSCSAHCRKIFSMVIDDAGKIMTMSSNDLTDDACVNLLGPDISVICPDFFQVCKAVESSTSATSTDTQAEGTVATPSGTQPRGTVATATTKGTPPGDIDPFTTDSGADFLIPCSFNAIMIGPMLIQGWLI